MKILNLLTLALTLCLMTIFSEVAFAQWSPTNSTSNNISRTGNVSIGEGPNSSFKLNVKGYLRVNSSSYSGRDYQIKCTNRQNIYASNDLVTYGKYNILFVTNANNSGYGDFMVAGVNEWNNHFIIKHNNGYTGIGTKNPSYKLDVNGIIRSSGGFIFSDKRFKDNIVVLDNSLSKLSQLRGVSYKFKTKEFADKNFADTQQLGFLAQEVEEVYPELVSTDNEGYKSVNYVGLIPVLVEALKTQNEKIAVLEAQVNKMATTSSHKSTINMNGVTLAQSIPNPSSEFATINYELPETVTNATLTVYDMSGKALQNHTLSTGQGTVEVDTRDFASGTYIYAITQAGKTLTSKKMVVQ